ncbi:DeoR/GlpR family DNA-binding transcription regulator [Cytobacillus massiliigabonensis]|uniref:DeoR/GlpR family DNA-binding transcription regulator n=1 Tax=Cytobacillus massiliigabonensis TaxID=1871011 RepID=UPI000C81844F|nr:DeoR/GlpR family DNA-binding transcription regulator [Cytobacillus massiliigabonensis]
MLVAERQEKISDIVNERGSIRVSELSGLFGVTEETIRRDLEKLEKEGYLRRTHGGAVSPKEPPYELSYLEREVMNVAEKKEVAEQALKYIQPYDRIILDASSTAWYIAKALSDFPLTVLTNSLKVAAELSNKEKITVHITGGMLWADSLALVGPLAEKSLGNYYVDKAFISCKGIDPEWGISDSNEFQALVKKKIIEISDTVYLLADYSKFGTKAFSHICHLNQIDRIITDCKTPNKELKRINA